MAKANKDGWIRHRGGKCPVAKGTLIDVVYRDGVENLGVSACTVHTGSVDRSAVTWEQWGGNADIMRWRLHKPEIEQSVVEIAVDGPLDWRDRIREIDSEESKRNEEHRQAIEAMEKERLSLVQKLEDEGFKLIEAKPACDGMPAEDMSDWRKWKAGDAIVHTGIGDWCDFTPGKIYHLSAVSENSISLHDDVDPREFHVDGDTVFSDGTIVDFEWHSRP